MMKKSTLLFILYCFLVSIIILGGVKAQTNACKNQCAATYYTALKMCSNTFHNEIITCNNERKVSLNECKDVPRQNKTGCTRAANNQGNICKNAILVENKLCKENEKRMKDECLHTCANPQKKTYYEDFESVKANWINADTGWSIIKEGNNHVYRQNELDLGGSRWKSTTLNFTAEEYNASVKVKILTSQQGSFGAALMIYKNNSGHFSVSEPSISLGIFPQANLTSLFITESGPYKEYKLQTPLEKEKWYELKIVTRNGLTSAWIDNQEVITNAPTSLKGGYVALVTDGIRAEFDNLTINI